MPNRLAEETSPYLLQHQNNPVNWHPWGDAALERARREQLPIFLSIGYSACHWCHVMEHESFEDPGIADQLNANFIPIKVDREERPDLDQIYMAAVQMLTGHGGWPMSVFLTPELKPFFGGTYWPPRSGRGMPGFDEILAAVADAWSNRREQALEGAEQLTARLRQLSTSMIEEATAVDQAGSQQLLDGAISQLTHAFDSRDGGFGQAPKFPHPMSLALLLRGWQRKRDDRLLEMVRTTLDRMANGGIYDHLGGGFARYSVDARWLVPHFEKMLYDNALLAGVYLQAFLVTQEPHYAQVVRETLDYLCREMSNPAGGIYSTEDADSEGVEGKFYTWTPADIEQVLGEGAATTFCHVYDVSTDGNFEGTNILHRHKTLAQCAAILNRDEDELAAELASSRKALFDAREQRVRPGRDDKILVAWNGLAIDVLARAGASLDHPEYLEAARQAASFILHDMRREDGRLLHTWRNGTAKLNAYLDDYACLANGLVSLHLASGDEHWIQAADGLMQTVLTRFIDAEGGGFYFTADDHEELITRNKEFTDSSTPSGNGMAATVLFRLGKILGRHDYLAAAQDTVRAAGDFMARAPLATGQLLLVLDDLLGPAPELVLLGDRQTAAMQTACLELSRHYLPRATVLTRDSAAGTNQSQCAELDPAFEGKTAIDGSPTLYVCENFRCQEPAQGLPAIEARLRALAVK